MNNEGGPHGKIKSLTIFAKKLHKLGNDLSLNSDLSGQYFVQPNMFVNLSNSHLGVAVNVATRFCNRK